MVTTGARAPRDTHPTAPPNVAYWVQFRRGSKYQGEYGFDWVEWTRNSANIPATDFDDMVSVTGTAISNFVECFDPGLPGIPAQPGTPGLPRPATPPAPAAAPPAATAGLPTQPEAPLQPITLTSALPPPPPLPATLPVPAKPPIPPRYAPVTGLYKQSYQQQLQKGYHRQLVQGNDYYVPWCSMRPHQTIQLKLEVEFLNKNPVQPTNHFTVLPDTNYLVTINSQPNTGPMNLLPVNGQVLDVTIECLHPAPETRLRVVDELGAAVGELTLAENLYDYQLPLRVVYVLLGSPTNPTDLLDQIPRRPLSANPRALPALQNQFAALRSQGVDFITFLNEHALNQACITCTVATPAKPYQLLIDPDQWHKDTMYSTATGELLDKDRLGDYCTPLVEALYGPAFAAFTGITMFVFQPALRLTPGGPYAASGQNKPVAARALSIFQAGLVQGKASTIAHEVAHVLGLTHSFPMGAGEENNDVQGLQNIVAFKPGLILKQKADLATLIAAAATPPTPAEQSRIKALQIVIKVSETELAESSARVAMYARNPFKFTQQSTKNLMDYDPGDDRCSLWYWQWPTMQSDVATYYGTKSLAK